MKTLIYSGHQARLWKWRGEQYLVCLRHWNKKQVYRKASMAKLLFQKSGVAITFVETAAVPYHCYPPKNVERKGTWYEIGEKLKCYLAFIVQKKVIPCVVLFSSIHISWRGEAVLKGFSLQKRFGKILPLS